MSINEKIAAYLEAKQEESSAKKRAAALKKEILAHAAGADAFTTDVWAVIVKRSISIRLDTQKLYDDFGEDVVKRDYGKESVSVTVDAVPVTQAETKTA